MKQVYYFFRSMALILGICFLLFAGIMAIIQDNQEETTVMSQAQTIDPCDSGDGYLEAIVIQNMIKSGQLSILW